MPQLLRWILIVAACILCWETMRSMVPLRAGAFADCTPFATAKKDGTNQGPPVFRNEVINPDQGLPMVHVASLAEMSDGRLVAVWYGGTKECHPDVKIYFSEMKGSGKAEGQAEASWSSPRVIMTCELAEHDLRRPVKSLGNAVLLPDPNGSLRLLFVTIAMGKWSGSQLNSCLSRDGGLSWSRSERLTLSPFFNFSELVRNRPIAQIAEGWCVPVYQEFLGKFPELLWLGEKEGRLSAQKTRIAGGCSTFQPSLIPRDGESADVLLRDYTDARKIHFSSSSDGGLTWPHVTATELPNPDAGISGLRLSDGRILIAFNDSEKDRSNLSLAIASEGGKTWKKIAVLEREPGAAFSYPYLMRSSDGMIRLAYTRKGKVISMTSFNEAWIAGQEAGGSKELQTSTAGMP